MTQADDTPDRVTRLEQRMGECHENAAAARALASAADRDVSDFRTVLKGHTGVLNALRDTQINHSRKLEQLDKIDQRLYHLDARMQGIQTGTDKLAFDMKVINSGMEGLTSQVCRLETRFGRFETGFDRLEDKVTGHDDRFDQLEARLTDGFSTLAIGQAQITALLNVAIGQSDGQAEPG